MRTHLAALLIGLGAVTLLAQTPAPGLPNDPQSVRFGVIGDFGDGGKDEYTTSSTMSRERSAFGFDFVITVGDNLYGSERPQDFETKFATPFKALLDGGVTFRATIGNHDDPNQRFYKPFNMNGERYYTYTKKNVQFFALDSNYMDTKQLDWLEGELKTSKADWKVPYFHHPLYSSGGTHGSSVDLRQVLEPLFLKYGVEVVFSGHDHFYERIKPQKGIYYFVVGNSGKLRKGDIQKTALTATGFDTDRGFMLIEINQDALFFKAVSRPGKVIDGGCIPRSIEWSDASKMHCPAPDAKAPSSPSAQPSRP